MTIFRGDQGWPISNLGVSGCEYFCFSERITAFVHYRQVAVLLDRNRDGSAAINIESQTPNLLRCEEDRGSPLGDKMFEYSGFVLFIDFELFEFAIFRASSIRSRFERTGSRDEADSVLRDVYVAKSV